MFADMGGQELPLISRVVFGFSDWMLARDVILPNSVWLLGGSVAIWLGMAAWGRTKKGRRFVDNLKLKIPIFGDIQQKSAIARFTRTLGTLVTSGVPILQALNITRDTAGNVIVSDAIDKVHEAVSYTHLRAHET